MTTSQEINPVASSSLGTRQPHSVSMKSPNFTHPTPLQARPATPSQTNHEIIASASQTIDFQQRTTDTNDPFPQQHATTKSQITTGTQQTNIQAFQSRVAADPYAQQPATPRPQFPRPGMIGFTQPVRAGEGSEINRQLRDLLQKQQFKKLDEQLLPGKGQQRVWPLNESSGEQELQSGGQNPGEATFRHPLPPGIIRPRGPLPPGSVVRQAIGGLRMQSVDTRMQNLDPRMRLFLQQVNKFEFKEYLLFFLLRYMCV